MSTIERQQQDIENILQERMEQAQKERTAIREALNTLDSKIKTVVAQFAANGLDEKRPKETIEEINAKISGMEFAHTTKTQTKAQEKELLRNIQKLQQRKKQVILQNQIQSEVDELKAKRAGILAELKSKDDGLAELDFGLRKIRTAMSLRVSISDIMSHTYAVPDDRLPQVIGKGGQNLRQIENDCGVSIESERYGSNELNILGTPAAIQMAIQSIDIVVHTIADEFPISEESVICLTIDKLALLQDLQNRYGVRVETNRTKKTCKIVGLQSIVEIVKAEILSLQSAREEIVIDRAMLPFIFGKGGIVVRGIGEDNHVHIDIDRDNSKIVVMGLGNGVAEAVNTIKSIADENKEITETLRIEKQIMIGCIIGPGGSTIRSIQTTFSVSLKTDKGVDIDALFITGTTAKVLAAKQYVLSLIEEYSKNSETISVPDECMPIILGKKGSRINALRDEHSSVNIDVDENSIRICGGTIETRTKAKEVIEDILASNWSSNVPCDAELGIVLKSAKGTDVRQQLVQVLNLNLDIDTDKSIIKLRGYRENVERGIELIATFLSGFQTLVVDLTDEDCASLMNGSSPGTSDKNIDVTAVTATTTAAAVAAATAASMSINQPESLIFSPTKYAETKFNVEVYINRKDCKLRLRGPVDAIEAARTYLLGVLSGDPSHGSILIPIDPTLYATLIGKAGSNLKKMEADLLVKFDILKSKSLLRIRGAAENIRPAKDFVIDFMDNVRASTNIIVPGNLNLKETERILDIFTNLYNDLSFNLNSQVIPRSLTLRGSLLLIEEAKVLIEEHFQNYSVQSVRLPQQFVETHRFERAWKKIRDVCSVNLDVVQSHNSTSAVNRFEVKLQGPVESVNKAKKLLYDALMTILPASTFVVLYMNSDQLKSLGLQKHIRDITSIPQIEDVSIDRPLSCIRLMSSYPDSVNLATQIVQERILAWDREHIIFGPLDGPFAWPMLIGKNGENIASLEKSLGVSSISFNRSSMKIIMKCKDPESAKSVIDALAERLEKIRSEHFEIELDENLIRAVIGKQGANIAKFRADLQANIDLDANILKISGSAENVNVAKAKILEFLEEEKQRSYSRQIYVPIGLIPRLIGLKGAKIRDIQKDTDTKIDLDKGSERGTIRGSVSSVEAAIKAIQQFFDNEQVELDILNIPPNPSMDVKSEEDKVEQEPEPLASDLAKLKALPLPIPQIKVGIPTPTNSKPLSKSAMKRLKKKEKQGQQSAPAPGEQLNDSISQVLITDEDSDEELPSPLASTVPDIPEAKPVETLVTVPLKTISVIANVVSEPVSPVKESIVAPIVSLSAPNQSQLLSNSLHTFSVDPPIPSYPNSNTISPLVPIAHDNLPGHMSTSDSLLSILLGRTPTVNAEAEMYNALIGGHHRSTEGSVTAAIEPASSVSSAQSSQSVLLGSNISSNAGVSLQSSNSQHNVSPSSQPHYSSQYSSVSSQHQASSNAMSQQSQGLQLTSGANVHSNFNSHLPIHIQQQAQQPFFNPNAAAYAPPGFNSIPMGINYSNSAMSSMPGHGVGISSMDIPPMYGGGYYNEFSGSSAFGGNDLNFPILQGGSDSSGRSKPSAMMTSKQIDYLDGDAYGMNNSRHSNKITSSAYAPPGLTPQQPISYGNGMNVLSSQGLGNLNGMNGNAQGGTPYYFSGASRPGFPSQMQSMYPSQSHQQISQPMYSSNQSQAYPQAHLVQNQYMAVQPMYAQSSSAYKAVGPSGSVSNGSLPNNGGVGEDRSVNSSNGSYRPSGPSKSTMRT